MKKIFLSAVIILAALTVAKPQNRGHRWVKVNSGNEIPPDAVIGGRDADGSPLIVAHANYGGNWHPGKTRRDWNSTSIEYGGKEVNVQDYEVLVGNEGLSWVRVNQGNIPENAVISGHENENNLITCRCEFQGSTQVGKTWQGINACRIGYGNVGNIIPNYEVLVHSGPGEYRQPFRENSGNIAGTWILTTSSSTGCDNSAFNYADSPCKDNGVQCATVVFNADNTWFDSNGGRGSFSINGDKLKLNSAVDGSFSEFGFRIENGILTKTQLQINNCFLTINYRRGN